MARGCRRCGARAACARLPRRHDRRVAPEAGSIDFREVPLRVRLGANVARLPDGLLVLFRHGVQRPAVPHARGRRRRCRGRRHRRTRDHLRRRRPQRFFTESEAALPRSVSSDGRRAARQAVDHAGHHQLRRRRRTASARSSGGMRWRLHRTREHRHQIAGAHPKGRHVAAPRPRLLPRESRPNPPPRHRRRRIVHSGHRYPEHGDNRGRHPAICGGVGARWTEPDDPDAATGHP